jgi:hypothetical protein
MNVPAIGRAQPAHACPVCGGEGVLGYRNSAGELDYYCADHRLAQCWADAYLTSSSNSERAADVGQTTGHVEPAKGNVAPLLDGKAPATPIPVVHRQVVPQPSRPDPGQVEEVKTAATKPYFDADGRFIHKCCRCGRDASFGFGVSLREGKLGTWFCAECLVLPPGSSR